MAIGILRTLYSLWIVVLIYHIFFRLKCPHATSFRLVYIARHLVRNYLFCELSM